MIREIPSSDTRSALDVAIQHISQTRNLLDRLITSSESFDYHAAKLALRELEKKNRELRRAQAELEQQRQPSEQIVIFPGQNNLNNPSR